MKMRCIKLLSIFIIFHICSSLIINVQAQNITVIDTMDGTPLQGTTIIGNSGLILGITDSDGSFPTPVLSQFPISIRSLGYEPMSISNHSDTIRLIPAVYSLNEVVVNQNERPIKRVICFAREYASGATGSDTVQLYSEYMLEAFLKDKDKKVKGYKEGDSSPDVRNVRRFARLADSNGLDSVWRPKENDDLTMLSWQQILTVPNNKIQERKELVGLSYSDTVMGKYGPSMILRKHNDILSITTDKLSDYKDHKFSPWFFKLLGLTMDVTNMKVSLAYKTNDTQNYSLDDFIYSTYSIHLLAKGKIFKRMFHTDSPIDMDAYIELYPVSVTYLTPEEYKEMRDDKAEIPFQTSPNQQPLPPGVQALVDREETI